MNKSSSATFARPEEIDVFLTDKHVSEEVRDFFAANNIELEIAE